MVTEIEWNGQNVEITCIGNDHRVSFFTDFENFGKFQIFQKNILGKLQKFWKISKTINLHLFQTVWDREKRTKLLDHMHCKWWQDIISEHFEIQNLSDAIMWSLVDYHMNQHIGYQACIHGCFLHESAYRLPGLHPLMFPTGKSHQICTLHWQKTCHPITVIFAGRKLMCIIYTIFYNGVNLFDYLQITSLYI